MHEHTSIYHHLTFSTWPIQKFLSSLSDHGKTGLSANTSYNKQVTESNWEVPSQYCFTAVYANRL